MQTKRRKKVGRLPEGLWSALLYWGRFGYVVRGVLFLLIGAFALRQAVGLGGTTAGTRDVLRDIEGAPYGQATLALVAVGLFGYVTWRFIQSVYDPSTDAEGFQKVVRRAAFAISGLFYSALAVAAGRLSVRGAFGGDEPLKDAWTAWLLSLPLGMWVVLSIALVIIAVGIHAIYRGSADRFMRLYRTPKMTDGQRRVAQWIGRIGLSAIGLALCIIGGILAQAAIRTNPDAVAGIGGALAVLAAQPLGMYLLAAAAIGFIMYGIHCFWLGRFRDMRVDD